jgi:murein DD-endopeptidase MepM/ murein hydrolase activator NlpD
VEPISASPKSRDGRAPALTLDWQTVLVRERPSLSVLKRARCEQTPNRSCRVWLCSFQIAALVSCSLKQPEVLSAYGSLTDIGSDRRRPRPHDGIDYGAKYGTEVIASHDGVVSWTWDEGITGGMTLTIKSNHTKVWTSYSHLGRIDVAEKQFVKRGAVLGVTGPSLKASPRRQHVHWSVCLDEACHTTINPTSLKLSCFKHGTFYAPDVLTYPLHCP